MRHPAERLVELKASNAVYILPLRASNRGSLDLLDNFVMLNTDANSKTFKHCLFLDHRGAPNFLKASKSFIKKCPGAKTINFMDR